MQGVGILLSSVKTCNNSLQAVLTCWVAEAVAVPMLCFSPAQEWESFMSPMLLENLPDESSACRAAIEIPQLLCWMCAEV